MTAEGQVLTFAVAGRALALPAGLVAEVMPMPPTTRVPLGPLSLKGLANVRGRAAPVVSLRALLGDVAGDEARDERRVIVLQGREPVGLAVDRVDAVAGIPGEATLIDPGLLLADAFAGWAPRGAGPRAPTTEAVSAASAQTLGFIEFSLAGQAYALPLEQVREVFDLAAEPVAMPGSEALMLGAVQHRDQLLPVVSLRGLLGLAVEPARRGDKVVVVSLGNRLLGLLVDRMRGVLRTSEAQIGPVPAVLNRGNGEAQIDAMVRTPDGLVSVLAAERIFSEDTVAAILAEAGTVEPATMSEEAGVEQILQFRLGKERYGLPVSVVSEAIFLPTAITPTPKAPPFLLGVANHRGKALPLIDQGRRFGSKAEGPRLQVIVCDLDGVSAGIVVDAIEQVRSVPEAALRAAPELSAADSLLFDRVALLELDGLPLLLIDPRRLIGEVKQDLLRTVATAGEIGRA